MRVAALVALTACLFSGAALSQPLNGTWRGACTRPAHPPANGNLIIQGGQVSFYGAPVEGLDLRPPSINFSTRQGTGAVLRRFSGTFTPDLQTIGGTLLQANQKWADCRFTYAQ